MIDLDIHLPGILLAYATLIIGICSPGPAVLAIIGTSMSRGRPSGVAMALGVVSGSVFWGISAAAGISAILTAFAGVLTVIKIIGGLFMLWLAYKAFKAASNKTNLVAQAGPVKSLSGYFMTGLLVHLTNPKAILAWVATITLGVTSSSPLWVTFAIVGGGAIISLVGNLGYAVLFSTDFASRLYLKARRFIQFTFGAFFTFAGLKLLSER